MDKIILVKRYDKNKVDQDFFDLEFARLDRENEIQ